MNDPPLHLMTINQTKIWMLGGEPRRLLARFFAKRYPGTGCRLLSNWIDPVLGAGSTEQFQMQRQAKGFQDFGRGLLIAIISPGGSISVMSPPFRRYNAPDIQNRPEEKLCACNGFWDPESKGPWGKRGDARGRFHHPLCEFVKTAGPVYEAAMKLAGQKQRPDELLRLEKEKNE